MSQVVCDISVSVDGYAAGPNQTEEKPFGDGPVDIAPVTLGQGERLFEGVPVG